MPFDVNDIASIVWMTREENRSFGAKYRRDFAYSDLGSIRHARRTARARRGGGAIDRRVNALKHVARIREDDVAYPHDVRLTDLFQSTVANAARTAVQSTISKVTRSSSRFRVFKLAPIPYLSPAVMPA